MINQVCSIFARDCQPETVEMAKKLATNQGVSKVVLCKIFGVETMI